MTAQLVGPGGEVSLSDETIAELCACLGDGGGGGSSDASEATLLAILAELQQKLEAGQQVTLSAASLAALETITVSGTVDLSSAALAALETVNTRLQMGGLDVSGSNPIPVVGTFADENGVPFGTSNPLPVDVGGSITIDNLTVNFDSVVSTVNSTETPLAADEQFVGAWEDVLDYAAITCAVFTDVTSAPNGAVVQFSSNGTDVVTQQAATVYPNYGAFFSFAPQARYFRILYTNGPDPQAILRTQVAYQFNPPAVGQGPLGGTLTDGDVVQVVQAALAGRHPSGLYIPALVDENGQLQVEVNNPVTSQLDALTDLELRATPVPVDAADLLYTSDSVRSVDAAELPSLIAVPFTISAAGTTTLVAAPGAGNGLLRLRRLSPTYAIRSPDDEPILQLFVGGYEAQRGNALTGRFDITASASTDAITLTVDVLGATGRVTGTVYYEVV